MGHFRVAAVLAALGLAILPHGAEASCNLIGGEPLAITRSGGDFEVTAKINGSEARFILDTGAFYSVITPTGQARLKLPFTARDIDFRAQGLGGKTNRVQLLLAKDFTFASTTFNGVEFQLGEKPLGDADGLLGENFLAAETVEYDLPDNLIRFFQPRGCVTEPLVYWSKTQPYSVVDIDPPAWTGLTMLSGHAWLNGVQIKVIFDTGAPTSIISLAAAERAGVRPFDQKVYAAGRMSGIAHDSDIPVWNAPFASFKLGDEQINNPRILIGRLGVDGVDMLVGADFFRSHRMIVSHTQNKLYFTYSGGQVFAASAVSAMTQDEKPLDAEGLVRRAARAVSDLNYEAAISDYTKAISLAPTSWAYRYDRGEAYRYARKFDLALADFDQALKLKPQDINTLVARAELQAQRADLVAARADLDMAAAQAGQDARWGLAIGQGYAGQDDYEKAVQWLDRWIAAEPATNVRMPEALNARCWARALLGRDLTKALTDCNASLKLVPGDPSVLDSRGLVRLRLGDFDGSLSDYNAAIAAHPDVAWSYYGRALAEENKGMMSEGESDERRAKKLAPDIVATAAKYGIKPPNF